MLVKEPQVIVSLDTHSATHDSLTHLCVTKGIMKYFKFSFCITLWAPPDSVNIFFRDFCSITTRNPTALIGCGNNKKIAQLDQPIPLEYWWILQIVFPAYRFVWSKCSTNNSILNAIDRLQKKSQQFLFSLALRTSTAGKQRMAKKHTVEQFPRAVIIFHILIHGSNIQNI